MATQRGKTPTKKVTDLKSRALTARQARKVRGGAANLLLPAVQKVREAAMGDGSVRPIANISLKQ